MVKQLDVESGLFLSHDKGDEVNLCEEEGARKVKATFVFQKRVNTFDQVENSVAKNNFRKNFITRE